MTTEPKQLAQVSYTVLDNSSDILIDIELDDYNDLCIKIGEEIIAKQQNDKIKDEEKPCISPSDML